jgi:hypothetical protein
MSQALLLRNWDLQRRKEGEGDVWRSLRERDCGHYTYLILADEDGVGPSIPGKMPNILVISRIVAEENRDATSNQAIEDPLPSGTIAGRLKTEH